MSFECKENLDVELDDVVPRDCRESSNGHEDSFIYMERRRGSAFVSPHGCGYARRMKCLDVIYRTTIVRRRGSLASNDPSCGDT